MPFSSFGYNTDNTIQATPEVTMAITSLFGLKLVSTVVGTTVDNWVPFRFPRSKKKRIRRKWAKKRCNQRNKVQYQTIHHKPSGTMYIHPEMLKKVEEAMQRENAHRMRNAVDAMSFSARIDLKKKDGPTLDFEKLMEVQSEMMRGMTRTFAMPGMINPTFDRIEPEAKKRKSFLTEYGGFNIVR